MKKFICLFLACAGLAACNSPKDEEYYFQHPNALTAAIVQCQRQGGPDCSTIYGYAVHLSQLMQDFQENQQAYGLKILHAQMQGQDEEVRKLRAVVGMYIRF